MTITALGEVSIGAAVPAMSTALSAGLAGIDAALPDLLDRIASLQLFTPQPISYAASLALAQSTVQSVLLNAALPVPSISAQIAAVAALIAELLQALSLAQAQVTLLTDLQTTLATAGVTALAFDGTIGALGGEVNSELSSWTGHANALLLVTNDPSAWSAMSSVFKVTP